MNRIHLPNTLWLASDFHLGPATPRTLEKFLSLLHAAAQESATLLLMGDIFDAWIGDDIISTPTPWLQQVVQALKQTSTRIPIWLGQGNRDFLLGRVFAEAVGARLLPEQALVETDLGWVLLSHGDEFCTDDHAYQQFRTMVRHPEWQAKFLAQSIEQRFIIVREARAQSIAINNHKAADIMDVNPQTIESMFLQHSINILIHGHTHRTNRHLYEIEGRQCERWVLPDWDFDHEPSHGGWLCLDQNGLRFCQLENSLSL